jgi:hypothetical protein
MIEERGGSPENDHPGLRGARPAPGRTALASGPRVAHTELTLDGILGDVQEIVEVEVVRHASPPPTTSDIRAA